MNRQMPKSLAQLLAGAGDVSVTGNPATLVSSITVDSRRVEAGALFVCLVGARADGHDHVADAIASGAVAVLAQRDVDAGSAVAVARVADTLAVLSPVAAALYDDPSRSLVVIGVTGTNGKTTTTHFIEAIAACTPRRFGIIGTLGARLRGRFEEKLEHTSPFSHDIQRLLARFRDAGAAGAAMEISSHALALHRVDDVSFDVATFTNLTQDHLDFHKTFDGYRASKARLFEMTARGRGKGPGVAVVNADDPAAESMARPFGRRLTFGMGSASAQLHASDISYDAEGTTFSVKALRPAPLRIGLLGPFNVSNAMAALASAVALDIDVEAIADGLESVRAVPGRMYRVARAEVGVYIDYAHTPDGLAQVLGAVRTLTSGRLICVFGCGGDRDPAKRPLMGEIARALSDFAIVTTDNPRYEDPDRIIEDITAGMRAAPGAPFEIESDRAAAIERAISMARPGDAVLIAGKGHESFQLVRGQLLPFSDEKTALAALAKIRA
jgi:UDP-N-acetylmuramoyl-L-alanyl-D-glutamate--2,6-diaminopimelate ligase